MVDCKCRCQRGRSDQGDSVAQQAAEESLANENRQRQDRANDYQRQPCQGSGCRISRERRQADSGGRDDDLTRFRSTSRARQRPHSRSSQRDEENLNPWSHVHVECFPKVGVWPRPYVQIDIYSMFYQRINDISEMSMCTHFENVHFAYTGGTFLILRYVVDSLCFQISVQSTTTVVTSNMFKYVINNLTCVVIVWCPCHGSRALFLELGVRWRIPRPCFIILGVP